MWFKVVPLWDKKHHSQVILVCNKFINVCSLRTPKELLTLTLPEAKTDYVEVGLTQT